MDTPRSRGQHNIPQFGERLYRGFAGSAEMHGDSAILVWTGKLNRARFNDYGQ